MDILAALYQAVLLLLGVYLVHQAANFVLRRQSLRCKRADLERRGLCIARDSDDARRARLVRELVRHLPADSSARCWLGGLCRFIRLPCSSATERPRSSGFQTTCPLPLCCAH